MVGAPHAALFTLADGARPEVNTQRNQVKGEARAAFGRIQNAAVPSRADVAGPPY